MKKSKREYERVSVTLLSQDLKRAQILADREYEGNFSRVIREALKEFLDNHWVDDVEDEAE